VLSVSIGGQRIALTYTRDSGVHVFTSDKFGLEARNKNQTKAHAEIVRLLKDLLA
jgi:hypothetical protein